MSRPRLDPPVVHVVGAAIVGQGACLAAQRGTAMSEPLKWEFPGGKVEPGEDPREALRREILEELDLEVEVGELLGSGRSVVDGRRIALDVYAAALVTGEVHLAEHRSWAWLTAAEVDRLDWAEADRPILPALKSLLGRLPGSENNRRRGR